MFQRAYSPLKRKNRLFDLLRERSGENDGGEKPQGRGISPFPRLLATLARSVGFAVKAARSAPRSGLALTAPPFGHGFAMRGRVDLLLRSHL